MWRHSALPATRGRSDSLLTHSDVIFPDMSLVETQLEVLFWFVAKFQDQNAFSLKSSEFSVVKETGPGVHSTPEAELPVVSSFDIHTLWLISLKEVGNLPPSFFVDISHGGSSFICVLSYVCAALQHSDFGVMDTLFSYHLPDVWEL